MPKYKVDVKGIDEVIRKLGVNGAHEVRKGIGVDVKEGVYNMAEQASDNAPVDTGALSASIVPTVEKIAPLSWRFGSPLPYAQRQEYEHKTHKAYFRRAIWAEQYELRDKMKSTIKRNLRR